MAIMAIVAVSPYHKGLTAPENSYSNVRLIYVREIDFLFS